MGRKKTPTQVANDLAKFVLEVERGLREFHMWAAEVVEMERRDGFQREESPDGKKWEPLKPETIERKSGKHHTSVTRRNKAGIKGVGQSARARKSKTPSKPLMDTGTMSKGRSGASKKKGWVKMEFSRSSKVTGDGKSIAEIHENGATIKGGRIPARPHWGIYKKARERIIDRWNKYIRLLLARAARG